MDSTAFNMLGLEVLRDNMLAKKGRYLTEGALREMELPMDAPNFHMNEEAIPIAGVVRDFHIGNITDDIAPAMIRVTDRASLGPWSILLEVEGNPYTAYTELQKIFKKTSGGFDFNAHYLDEQVQESFETERYVRPRSFRSLPALPS